MRKNKISDSREIVKFRNELLEFFSSPSPTEKEITQIERKMKIGKLNKLRMKL